MAHNRRYCGKASTASNSAASPLQSLSILDEVEHTELDLFPTPPKATFGSAPLPPAANIENAPKSFDESIAAIARRVAAGHIAPSTIVDRCLERIARLEPQLNAFVTITEERARADAAHLESSVDGELPVLAGVPIAHKDILMTAGIATSAGSRRLAGWIPDADATVVRRLSEAGTLLLGKANTHEYATGVTGTVSAAGATLNPWDTSRIAGGSSCGSAVAVAAGMVAAATGTDTGGSIRIPAACCGLAGIKPSYDRVSRRGVLPFSWTLDHVGALARRSEDLAALLAVMLDSPAATAPARPLSESRFAIFDELCDQSQPAVAAAVREAAVTLERLGARRCVVPLPEAWRFVHAAATAIFLAEGGVVHGAALRAAPTQYEEQTRRFLSLADALPAARYAQALGVRRLLSHQLERMLGEVDLLLCPTLPMIAPPLEAEAVELPDGVVDVRAALTRFTRVFNLTGLPAVSLPCGFDRGLPIGLQIAGRAGDDGNVLLAGIEFEGTTDWVRTPPITAPGSPV